MNRQAFLQKIVLAYTHLWILEGAFRKWVPGSSEVMYFARDGLLILALCFVALIYPSASRRARSPLFWVSVLALCVWALLGAIATETPLAVVLVGLRAYIAPLLLVYVVWRNDLNNAWRVIARAILLYAPLQAALVIAQVLSPLSSPVNAYAGGSEGTFVTADGIARATGTFTFAQGLTIYATIAVAVSVGALFSRLHVSTKRLAAAAFISCVVMVAVSGSRGLLLNAALVVAIILLGQVRLMRGRDVRVLLGVGAMSLASWLLIQVLLADALSAFATRIDVAASSEDPVQRILTGAFGFLSAEFALLGNGAGAHSQAGQAAGSLQSWIESDSLRWVSELGIAGLVLATASRAIGIFIVAIAVFNTRRVDPLHTALRAVVAVELLIGSITGTPTAQGAFGVAVAALVSIGLYEAHQRSSADAAASAPTFEPLADQPQARFSTSASETRS